MWERRSPSYHKLLLFSQVSRGRWAVNTELTNTGTIIMTGTPAGVGGFRKDKIWLKPGDEIRTEVGGGIGTLINHVRAEPHRARL